MLNNIKGFKLIFLMVFLSMWSIIGVTPGSCETEKKVAVFPLEMNATEDLTFLQKGLFSMLSARLADPGKVKVLEREIVDEALVKAQSSDMTKGTLNEAKARLIGAGLGVDYVLFGSVTMFGQSVSLDTAMVDVNALKPTLTFSKQAAEPGAVITELDQIAAEINLKTFNRKPEQIVPKEQYAQQPEVSQGVNYTGPLGKYRSLFAGGGNINGVSTADMDGDKRNEVVIVYDHAIEILKDNLNGQLVSVQKIKDGPQMDIVGVDAADINKNGMAEIFVTRVERESGYARSIVFEYDGTAYKQITKPLALPWYLRLVKDVNGHPTLYAQFGDKQGPYAGRNVFKVRYENNAYVPGEKIGVPNGFSVMSLAIGDAAEKGTTGAMFTSDRGVLTIFNETGSVEWSGETGYGGSRLYFTFVEGDNYIPTQDRGYRTYFQPRNIVADMNSDGKSHVLVIKNKESAGDTLGQIKNYRSGSIEFLSWNELGISAAAPPKGIPGQITDMVIGDFDNDSKNELIVTLVKKRNNFSAKRSKSMIIAYEIEKN